ncbi:MAG: Gx transporter family protein, partial [Clostridiales Family XIII bacterium]|nr:Gx transporter family protein [Clostridiales Family XIII bacterium]
MTAGGDDKAGGSGQMTVGGDGKEDGSGQMAAGGERKAEDSRQMTVGDGQKRRGAGRVRAADVALTGVFLAVILAVGLLERMVPLDFLVPGARLGLSNIVILLSLCLFPLRVTLALAVLKCLLLSALVGGPSSFLYSLGGTMLALVVMGLLLWLPGRRVGLVGVSVAGAAAHSVGQVAVSAVILENAGMFAYLPFLLAVSLASGFCVGVLARLTLPRVEAGRGTRGDGSSGGQNRRGDRSRSPGTAEPGVDGTAGSVTTVDGQGACGAGRDGTLVQGQRPVMGCARSSAMG